MASQACPTCSLSHSGHCPCPAAQQRACPRGQASKGGGHGVHPAPTCNRGALVFVSCSLARAPQMSGVARLFPCPSSLHGRVQPGLAPSPLGREEGSARAQAPPQPRTRPWPGHEHLALPGEQASRALCNREQPSPLPQALGPKPVPQVTDGQSWASQPGNCYRGSQRPGCCADQLPLRAGRGPVDTSQSRPGHPSVQWHRSARWPGAFLATVSGPRAETSPLHTAHGSLSPSLPSSSVKAGPCQA